jgi:hypothetical protein
VTEKSRKQLAVLGVLVTVLVVVMFVVSRGEGPSGGANQPARRGAAAGAKPQQAPLPVADVNLEALKAEHADPQEPERNPFVFEPKAAPPPPPRPALPPRPTEVAPPPQPTGPPPPPPIPLKFIGVLEIPSQNAKVAVLSDGRGGTYHAREGETVLGQYKLLKIGAESAEMSYVDGRGRQTLRLSGQ